MVRCCTATSQAYRSDRRQTHESASQRRLQRAAVPQPPLLAISSVFYAPHHPRTFGARRTRRSKPDFCILSPSLVLSSPRLRFSSSCADHEVDARGAAQPQHDAAEAESGARRIVRDETHTPVCGRPAHEDLVPDTVHPQTEQCVTVWDRRGAGTRQLVRQPTRSSSLLKPGYCVRVLSSCIRRAAHRCAPAAQSRGKLAEDELLLLLLIADHQEQKSRSRDRHLTSRRPAGRHRTACVNDGMRPQAATLRALFSRRRLGAPAAEQFKRCASGGVTRQQYLLRDWGEGDLAQASGHARRRRRLLPQARLLAWVLGPQCAEDRQKILRSPSAA